MEKKPYSLRLMTEKDKRDVVEFLTKFFFVDEPLNIESGMKADYLNGKRSPELENYCTESIPEGNSVVALSPAGKPVGVCICGSVSKNDPKDGSDCPNEKFRKVLKLLSAAEKQADLFNRYPVLNKLLDVKILSVDTTWRRMGICKSLLDYARKLAKEQNYQMLKIDCTSNISATVVEGLGFEKVHVMKYADYVDNNNKPVFTPPPPHVAIQVYVYKLQNI